MKKKSVIDEFSMPLTSKVEFLKQTTINLQFLSTIDGFIDKMVYEEIYADTQIYKIITIVSWRDQTALDHAKILMQAKFKSDGFNPQEFAKKLQAEFHRGIYSSIQ